MFFHINCYNWIIEFFHNFHLLFHKTISTETSIDIFLISNERVMQNNRKGCGKEEKQIENDMYKIEKVLYKIEKDLYKIMCFFLFSGKKTQIHLLRTMKYCGNSMSLFQLGKSRLIWSLFSRKSTFFLKRTILILL